MNELATNVVQVIDAEIIENPTVSLSDLQKMGFDVVVTKLTRAQKMKIAYAKYGYVTQEAINRFNEKLRNETLQEDKNASRYKTLVFISPKSYGELPPTFVLDKMRDAMADNIFDFFEIAKIDWKTEIK